MTERYDVIVVGAGTSGLNLARDLAAGGLHCLVLEAGGRYDRRTYPRTEVDGSAQLFWGGGVELNADASLAILRPKVVGGGSIVNQALMDRFDDVALDDFRAASGVDLFTAAAMAPYYDRAEANIRLQTVPEQHRNGNAEIFAEGFTRNGYRHAPLRRAQADCRFEDGNSCIECLSGCRIDSKNRGIRNTFDVVPDAPVDTFTLSMQGGKKGLLVNSTNLCKGSHRADVRMTGQNGKTYNSKPVLSNSCKKRKTKKSKKAKTHKRSSKR